MANSPLHEISRPGVSVLLSVFDESPRFLQQALDSVLSQTFTDFEFVILDDGSTRPDTIAMLDRYRQADARIRLCTGPNRGLTRSLNIGLEMCRGELICRHDSDDWSEPNRLAKQVQFLLNHLEIGMVGSNITFNREDGAPLWDSTLPLSAENVLAAFPKMNPFCHGAVCFRKAAAESVGKYRETLYYAQDYDLFWRLCERYGGANLPDVLYHLRRTANSISANSGMGQARVVLISRQLAKMRQLGVPEDFNKAAQIVDKTLQINHGDKARGLLKRADYLLLAGRYRRSLGAYLHGVALQPFRLMVYLKLLRWALFILTPPLRRQLFSPPIWLSQKQ